MEIFREKGTIGGFRFEQPFGPRSCIDHCGEILVGSLFNVGWHRHDGMEAVFLQSGTIEWELGGRRHRQNGGDLFIALPGERHRSISTPQPGMMISFLGWMARPGDQASKRLRQTMLDRRERIIPALHDAGEILSAICRQASTPQPMQRQAGEAYLRSLLAVALQAMARSVESGARPIYSYPIQKVLSYMRSRLDISIPIWDLAAIAGLGPSRFHQVFRREVGVSPVKYHRMLRLDRAKTMLGQRDFSITQIAMACGFCSSQHLCHEFRRRYDAAPGLFRLRG